MSLQVFGCPECAQPFQVDSSQAGQQVRCPGCNGVVQIPAGIGGSTNAEPAQPPAPEPQEVPEAFDCPSCASAFGVLPSMYGTSMACPHCGQAVSIVQPLSPAPTINVDESPAPDAGEAGPIIAPLSKQKKTKARTKKKPPAAADQQPAFPNIDTGDTKDQKSEFAGVGSTAEVEQAAIEPEVVSVFQKQNVDHLLPPRFATLDPAFFYRRGNQSDQVLLPQADGTVQAVNNRIVTIVHNGQEYQLVSSERYRRNLDIIVNSILVLIAVALLVAIYFAVA